MRMRKNNLSVSSLKMDQTVKQISERRIYDQIVANLNKLHGSKAATLHPIQKEFPFYGKVSTCEEIKDPSLRSIINDHNYISTENSYSPDIRQNLIDFVQLTNSAFTTTPNLNGTHLEILIDSVLALLSKITDYNLTIQKIKAAGILIDKNSKETECRIQSSFNKHVDLDIKLELSTPVQNEREELSADMEAPPVLEVGEREMILKKEQERIKYNLKHNKDGVLKETSNLNKGKVEFYDSSFENKKNKGLETKTKNLKTLECYKTNHSYLPYYAPITTDDFENIELKYIENFSEERTSNYINEKDYEDVKNPSNIEWSETILSKKIKSSDVFTKHSDIPAVVRNLIEFSKQLIKDCYNFTEKVDFKLENFLSLKYSEYKSIINPVLFKEASMQTSHIDSKKKLWKINASAKRHLLESSSESDSSNSACMYETLKKVENQSSKESAKDSKYVFLDSGKQIPAFNKKFLSNENKTFEQTRYIDVYQKKRKRSSISPTKEISLQSIPSSLMEKSNIKSEGKDVWICENECDKENTDSVTSFESWESKHSKNYENFKGNKEKEVERLLNLKSLAEPYKKTNSHNYAKQIISSKLTTSKNDSLFSPMQEVDRNSTSDECEDEDIEFILTEKQFLVQYNENLKKQLLDIESSDSEIFTCSEENEVIIGNYCDEENQSISYLDKFLETLVDDECRSSTYDGQVGKNEPLGKIDIAMNLILNNDEKEQRKKSFKDAIDTKNKENKKKSFESIQVKNTQQRALKLYEDHVGLSAESSYSDSEDLFTVETEKKMRIKPMLRHDQLESETLNAKKKETVRLRRLEKKNIFLAKMLKYHNENSNEKNLVLDYASMTKKFIKVHPDIAKHLKPHQRDGVKFMYDCCYGSVDALKGNSGSGCILAHCMGLGKTLQVIALLHTVTSYKELNTSKILVLCPKSTIMNWVDEIKRWLQPLEVKKLQIFNFSDTADIYDKINVIRKWATLTQISGCLIMGYEAFRSLVFYNTNKTKARSNIQVDDIRKNIHKYLLKPGAELVICDEGHIIKNRKSGISLAAAEISTHKRIILTGTPIQNNLKEYYAMVNFIKPLILGTEKEFANLYANPIKNGQHKDSSKRDIKVMKQRSFVLHKKLSKFVQRKEAELLQSFLPQKFEYVLFIPMTDVQNTLYEFVLNAISKRDDSHGKSLIPDYTCLRKIWTHPKVLEDAWKNAMAVKNKKEFKSLTSNHITQSDDDQPDDIYDSQTGAISVQSDWWRDLVTESDLEFILPSKKLKTMFEIIRMAEENGEKCLIFTAFVAVLNVVEYFFHKINDKQGDFFKYDDLKTAGRWISGQDYYRLDGKTNKTLRHEMVKRFNDPKNNRTRVFLISAKAGGQGINLIGANRVIILDTSWNPANDQQNIFRIFRLGQEKNCYVYRLIAMGTMEEKVYSRSVTKQAMSFRVVDEQQIDRHYNMAELAELYTLNRPDYSKRPVPVFPQDQILANLLLNFADLVFKYHEHDSLLENKMEQELSEQEKADAWVAYERDLRQNSEPRDVMGVFHGYELFGQENLVYPSMFGLDPKTSNQNNYDSNQLGRDSRNKIVSTMVSDSFNHSNINRNSYIDIFNIYKNISSPLLVDKNERLPNYTQAYALSLDEGFLNTSLIIPRYEHHPSKESNSCSPFSNSFLSQHTLLRNTSQITTEIFEQSGKLMAIDNNFSTSIRNRFPTQMSDSSRRDLVRSIHRKRQSPTSCHFSRKKIEEIPQNFHNIKNGRETIQSSMISQESFQVPAAKPSQTQSSTALETRAEKKPQIHY